MGCLCFQTAWVGSKFRTLLRKIEETRQNPSLSQVATDDVFGDCFLGINYSCGNCNYLPTRTRTCCVQKLRSVKEGGEEKARRRTGAVCFHLTARRAINKRTQAHIVLIARPTAA